MKNEIILYRPDAIAEHIEVRLEEETVWLSQQQMATLFNQTKQNISLHISNCFKEGELEKISTVKESLTVQKEGNRSVKRKIEYYNLDVILRYRIPHTVLCAKEKLMGIVRTTAYYSISVGAVLNASIN